MNNVEIHQVLWRITKIFYFFGIMAKHRRISIAQNWQEVLLHVLLYFVPNVPRFLCVSQQEWKWIVFFIAVEIMVSVLAFVNVPIGAHLTNVLTELNPKTKNLMNFVHSYLTMIGMSFAFYIISSLPIWPTERKLPLLIPYINFVDKYSEIVYWIQYAYVVCGFTCTLMNVIICYIMFSYSVEY